MNQRDNQNVEDDEAFARMLQLQEQSQGVYVRHRASSRQEMRDWELAQEFARKDFRGSSTNMNEGGSNDLYEAPNREKRDHFTVNNDSDYTLSTRGSSYDDRPNDMLPAYEQGSSSFSDLSHRRGQDTLAHARRLQEKAFLELAHSSQPKLLSREEIEHSDHEMARRMQAMEAKRALDQSGNDLRLDESDATFVLGHSHSSFASGSRMSQEEEDERLARFLEESGASFRELSETQLNDTWHDSNSSRLQGSQSRIAAEPGRGATSDAFVPAWLVPDLRIASGIPDSPLGVALGQQAFSAPTTPTRLGIEALPMLDPLESGVLLDVPRTKEKRKKFRNLLAFGQKKPPMSPTPSLTASPGRSTAPRASVLPPSHAVSPVPFRRRPGSPHRTTIRSQQSPTAPLARLTVSTVSRSDSARHRRPGPATLGEDLPTSPLVAGTRDVARESALEEQAQVLGVETVNSRAGLMPCSICRRRGGPMLFALDKKYHRDCFRCISCHECIDPSSQFAYSRDGYGERHPLHRRCFATLHSIKCVICNELIPANDDGTVSFVKHPFFDHEFMCAWHAETHNRRCSGCHRFEPERESFVDLNDAGRCVCFACCRSVIVDSSDVDPLWNNVLNFFEYKLGLPVWEEMRHIAILVVQSDALNDQMDHDVNNPHRGAGNPMASGLCLTDHQHGRRFKLPAMRYEESSRSLEALDAEDRGFTYFEIPEKGPGNPDSNVFAILCLSGLPRDLTASILAHEATHAWIKLHPKYNARELLPAQVEEGCAQLISMLLLTDGLDPADMYEDEQGPSDARLRQYFKFNIERDGDEIYGEGYRKAARAYSEIGIEALLSHVVRYREFPST